MALPEEPYTRVERYLARLSGQNVDIPDYPITRIECYLDYLCGNGGGVSPTAGGHNSVFRGANLGSTYTEAQADAIDSGDFTGLFLGDYWEMPWGESQSLVRFRIVGFDTYYKIANTTFLKHHVVVVPDSVLDTTVMNDTSSVDGGYAGTTLRTTVLPTMLTQLESLFGSTSILESTIISNGINSVIEVPTRIDIMNMSQLTGDRYSTQRMVGEMTTQLPAFAFDNSLVHTGNFWLQDIHSGGYLVSYINGTLGGVAPVTTQGVRPYFCLGKA